MNGTDVKVASYRKGQGRVIKETKAEADFIAMSGGWNPALHLWCHNGGKIRFDEAQQSFRPDRHGDPVTAIGAANGTFALPDILAEAQAAGERAVRVAERVAGRIWLYPRNIPSSAACRCLGVNEFWRLFSFPHVMLR